MSPPTRSSARSRDAAASNSKFRRCTRRSSAAACRSTSTRARGIEIEREPRPIRIDRLELVRFEPPHVALSIACSKGTYVRSLVADLGADLGCGANLAQLRRTRSGRFSIDAAQQLDALDPARILAMADVLELPIVTIPEALVTTIRNGIQHPLDRIGAPAGQQFQMFDEARGLLAIGHDEDGHVVYDRVFTGG